MTGIEKKNGVRSFLLPLLLLCVQFGAHCQSGRDAKVAGLYKRLKEYDIECPKTVLAIVVFETGWMECNHCTYQYNNLFGFRANGDYLRFNSIDDCLAYFKVWQTTYYVPWKKRHPNGTYYEYMAHVKYAHLNMAGYLRTIRAIERLISPDIDMIDSSPRTTPGIETDDKKE